MAAAKCVHQHGVRAPDQRSRADRRQSCTARWRDRTEIGRHHPLRGQPRPQLQQLLLSHLLHAVAEVCPPGEEKAGAEVYQFYIDMRTPAKSYDEFYQRILKEGVHFVRGKVAEVTDVARGPEKKAS
jgi:hypothetical protein